jgi:hypothetical protein
MKWLKPLSWIEKEVQVQSMEYSVATVDQWIPSKRLWFQPVPAPSQLQSIIIQ